ncbi:hypothetical protein NEIFLAOT_00078 [Neisseria flavescens NRL30031/H210]|uniref:Uncharacterized protein n=1 Tax=Neisseria flavescens NRL30031/H210 TaxID=546264 RepID=C0EJJ0_NEIFL|nr:hypothetical protein NEIFLAOT_00078 [Neisseria flavescens NRL30031/H210]
MVGIELGHSGIYQVNRPSEKLQTACLFFKPYDNCFTLTSIYPL